MYKIPLLFIILQLYWRIYFSYQFKSNTLCTKHVIYMSDTNTKINQRSSSATIMIKKNKIKDIELLKQSMSEEGNSHIINHYLATGERPPLTHVTNFRQSILNRFNTLSILPEYNKKVKTGFILGLPPPEILGGALRDAGSRAIIVSVDKRSGSVTTDEFYRMNKEQNSVKKLIPGPVALVWNDFIVDDVQILHAATLGASAVILDLDFYDDNETLKRHIKLCKTHNMEPITMVRTESDCFKAFDNGASCLCLHQMEESQYVELKSKLPVDDNYIYIAKLRAEVDFSVYAEIDMSWVLRDVGFHCIWPSPEAIYGTGMSDIYSNIGAMRAKASKEFLSPRQYLMDRKREGAKEFLGNIYF